MTSTGPGRPRLQQPSRPGATARDEILDAAAELFTTNGFSSTSTRSIADAVGIRQASLYHHFKTKNDILEALLEGTVSTSHNFAAALVADPRSKASALTRLHAVVLYDSTQLCNARWNLGVLYHLPEVRSGRFERFHANRYELRELYKELGNRIQSAQWTADIGLDLGDFAFRLTESLIQLRADGLATQDSPMQIADSVVAFSGHAEDLVEIKAESHALVTSWISKSLQRAS